MGSSESPWVGDPTPTAWDGNGEALRREGRLWAKKGGSAQRREALSEGQVGRSRCWLPWRRDHDPGLKWSGQHFQGADKELQDRRPPGAHRPDVRLAGGSDLPHLPARLFPAVLKVDRATSYFSFLFILCWSMAGQQHCDSSKCTDSTIHTCTCSFSSFFPMQVIT